MITPGGSGPRPGGRRRATAGDTAAAFELSDALIGVQRRQHGKHELFEHLTGPEQSWWRCCRDAVRSSDAWLNGNQADQALALIRGEDLARSDGALASAAATTLWISRALTTHDEHRARDLVNKAARGWRNAGPSAPMPDGGTSLSLERALARVDPDLRGRTAALLAVLDGAGREPGQAMAAISVLMLAGVRPGSRTVCMPVTLTAARDGEVIGVAGRITVRTFPGGPAGLFPDPSTLLAIPGSDRDLDQALDLAWGFAAGRRPRGRCVLWRLCLDPRLRAWTVDGNSLGAAFAVAVHELLRRGPASVPRALARPAGFFSPLRSRCTLTGELTPEPSGAHGPARARARNVGLGAVGELAAKGRAARANGWQLVAPQANRDPDGARVPEVVRVSWAATARGADRHARQVRPLRIVLVVVAALVLASFVNARVSAGTASGGAVQAQPQAPVSTSLPPTAGLLTGPQLQALLVPVSRFPASYTFENELAGNSGPSLVDVPYLLGCDNFAQLPDLGSQDLGAAAEASATLQNTKDTNEFNQGIFQFWNHDQATAFFAKAHALLSSCFANTQDIHNTVHSTATNGLPAFTDTMTTDIGIGATLFAVQGVSVYFAGAYSPNSHLIPRTPSLSSLVIQLVANVGAHAAGTSSSPSGQANAS